MDAAKDIFSGKLVSARSASKHGNYNCPRCKARVYLKRGTINEPHFAHESKAADKKCELYHEASGTYPGHHYHPPVVRPRVAPSRVIPPPIIPPRHPISQPQKKQAIRPANIYCKRDLSGQIGIYLMLPKRIGFPKHSGLIKIKGKHGLKTINVSQIKSDLYLEVDIQEIYVIDQGGGRGGDYYIGPSVEGMTKEKIYCFYYAEGGYGRVVRRNEAIHWGEIYWVFYNREKRSLSYEGIKNSTLIETEMGKDWIANAIALKRPSSPGDRKEIEDWFDNPITENENQKICSVNPLPLRIDADGAFVFPINVNEVEISFKKPISYNSLYSNTSADIVKQVLPMQPNGKTIRLKLGSQDVYLSDDNRSLILRKKNIELFDPLVIDLSYKGETKGFYESEEMLKLAITNHELSKIQIDYSEQQLEKYIYINGNNIVNHNSTITGKRGKHGVLEIDADNIGYVNIIINKRINDKKSNKRLIWLANYLAMHASMTNPQISIPANVLELYPRIARRLRGLGWDLRYFPFVEKLLFMLRRNFK